MLFKHRAKVYRHDDKTKEWKERGVGHIKVLHNRARQTFRLLLRREQVHKVGIFALFLEIENRFKSLDGH